MIRQLYKRKRDGSVYATDPKQIYTHSHWGPTLKLIPRWDGRTHYKSVAAFEREYVKVDE